MIITLLILVLKYSNSKSKSLCDKNTFIHIIISLFNSCCRDCCAVLAFRYAFRKRQEEDVCEELVLMLTDALNRELSEVGPEDILSESQLEELRSALEQQVMVIRLMAD